MGDETNVFYPGRGIKTDRKRSGLLQVDEFPDLPTRSLCHPFAVVHLA